MTISPILPRGEAVPEGFRLPHNTTRTMADVLCLTEREVIAERLRPGVPRGLWNFDPPAIEYVLETEVRKYAGGKE